MDTNKLDSQQPLLVAALDFGTTYSGWAYQFYTEYKSSPTKVSSKDWNDGSNLSSKTPSALLIRPDGCSLEAFGYGAENKYADLVNDGEHTEWYFFRRFKMKLFKEQIIDPGMEIEAENGKKLPALLVFSLFLGSLKDSLLADCCKRVVGGIQEDDIRWVITVPAIWSDHAKRFMRDAAVKAGIQTDKLVMALEPEAASVYCKLAVLDRHGGLEGVTCDTFAPGTKYVVLDCGGGTIDINVHEVLGDNNLREMHKPTGSNSGGTQVDEQFENLLCELFGKAVMENFRRNYIDDYLDLFRSFEVKKRAVSLKYSSASVFHLPQNLVSEYTESSGKALEDALSESRLADSVSLVRGNKLKLEDKLMHSLYEESINNIVSQLHVILQDPRLEGCRTILMVGGYSEAHFLRNQIRENFSDMNVISPGESGLIVLKGAVLYGWNPRVVASRVCKYTYGIKVQRNYIPDIHPSHRMFVNKDGKEKVKNIFRKIVEVGQEVLPEQPYDAGSGFPPNKSKTGFSTKLYASSNADPKYTDEPGCFLVGKFKVDCRDKDGHVCRVDQQIVFGGTEVEFRVSLRKAGEESRASLSLPD